MVALPTPARAATASTQTPSKPCSANRSRVASMIACSACSLRGRPGRREVPAGPASVLRPGPFDPCSTITGGMGWSPLSFHGLEQLLLHYGQLGLVLEAGRRG